MQTESAEPHTSFPPEYQLLSKLLHAPDPAAECDSTIPEALRGLARILQKNEMAAEIATPPCDPATAQPAQLKTYILAFIKHGLDGTNPMTEEIADIKSRKLSHRTHQQAMGESGLFSFESGQRGGVIQGYALGTRQFYKDYYAAEDAAEGDWVWTQHFLKYYAHKEASRENIMKLGVFISTLLRAQPPLTFEIEGKHYRAAQLFRPNARFFDINLIATDLLMEGCGWLPMLKKEDRATYIPIYEVAQRIYGNYSKENAFRLKTVAKKLLSNDTVDTSMPDAPNILASKNIVKYARAHGNTSYYFALSSLPSIEKMLGIERTRGVPEECGHFISDTKLADGFGLKLLDTRRAIKEITQELWQTYDEKGGIPLQDSGSGQTLEVAPPMIIRECNLPGKKFIYYLDPRAAEQYFSKAGIIRYIEKRQAEDHVLHPGGPLPQPPETSHWLSSKQIAQRCVRLSTTEAIAATTTLMKQLHEEGNPQIGYFSRRWGGAAHLADPEIVGEGKPISRTRIIKIMREQAQNPEILAVTSPER